MSSTISTQSAKDRWKATKNGSVAAVAPASSAADDAAPAQPAKVSVSDRLDLLVALLDEMSERLDNALVETAESVAALARNPAPAPFATSQSEATVGRVVAVLLTFVCLVGATSMGALVGIGVYFLLK